MSTRRHSPRCGTKPCGLFLPIILSSIGSGWILAADSPDLEVNPSTGRIELVDVSPADGGRVRHVEDSGQGGPGVGTLVSTEPAADSRIAIKANGESWAVWQAATGQIRCAYRNTVTKTWTPEKTVSAPGEPSRHPSIAHSGSATWVAFEIDQGGATAIGVNGIPDSPEPWPIRKTVASTSFNVPDVSVRAEAGRVLVTWVDSGSYVGWSLRDPASGTWSAPQYESYVGSTVGSAREAIRSRVAAP